MVYRMFMRIDGGCRRNGSDNPIGAAAVHTEYRYGKGRISTYTLGQYPKPTSQRAELHAVILALENALKRARTFHSNPKFKVTIYMDSKYTRGCMTDWINKWRQNGFLATTGKEVVNRDLIEQAHDLEEELKEVGSVRYLWVPRHENQKADAAVNKVLDTLEDYYYSIGYY